jgi:polyphosphate kinase 2
MEKGSKRKTSTRRGEAPQVGAGTRPQDAAGEAATRLSNKAYDKELKKLHIELVKLQQWVVAKGLKVCILFEGRDGAGKGGTIKAITERVSPRVFRVVALPAPTEREKSQMYIQRYLPHLPAAGEVIIFDRSWYNRAGVERVMGFCTEYEAKVFLKQAPVFERMLVDDGILFFKYWLTVDQAQQEQRFAERRADPLKRWKLSPIDLEARAKYDDYTHARERMLEATHTKYAPWTLVDFNDQHAGRLALIRHLLDHIPERKVPETLIDFPPLGHAPLVEQFKGPWKPI